MIAEELLQGCVLQVDDLCIPLLLVGDSAYPLLLWLMKSFAHLLTLMTEQEHFIYCLYRVRVVVDVGFGRLKACW